MNKLELTFKKPEEELPVELRPDDFSYDIRREFLVFEDWEDKYPHARYNWARTIYNFDKKEFSTNAKVLLWAELPHRNDFNKIIEEVE